MSNHNIESLLIGAWDTMAKTMDKIDLCLNMTSLSYMERESMDQKKTFAQLKKDCVDAIDDLQLECDHINEERNRIQAENNGWRTELSDTQGSTSFHAVINTDNEAFINNPHEVYDILKKAINNVKYHRNWEELEFILKDHNGNKVGECTINNK